MVDTPAPGQQSGSRTGITLLTALGSALAGGLIAAIVLSLILALFGAFGGSDTEIGPDGFISANFARSVADIAAPSVVAITAGSELRDPNTGARTSVPASGGSGVIISEDGYIVTNNHVITKTDLTTPEDEVLVQFGAENVTARIVGRDAMNDIAVLKVDRKGLKPIAIGSSDELKPGDPIVVIGNPQGVGMSVATGIVSATGRTFGGELYGQQNSIIQLAAAIQVDAAVNQGNSGGALVNAKGELVGIPSAGLGAVLYERGAQGLNYCIPIDLAKGIIEDLIANGRSFTPYLGANAVSVDLQSADLYSLPVDHGAFIDTVDAGSPAEKSGLYPGDIIATFDGKDIVTALDLTGAIRSKDVGQSAQLGIWRFDQNAGTWSEFSATVTLVKMPSAR